MNRMSRRGFMSRAALAGVTAAGVLGAARTKTAKAATSKLNIACIGIGGMGGSNLRACADENIVALCDVDEEYAAKAFAAFPEAKKYKDYREMLAQENDIDAVVIATPDHSHAAITMACLKAKKHVYCQKPLTQQVGEARMVTEAAKEAGVVTQMGIQGHSMDGMRQIKEWIDAGVIGEVTEVESWCSLCNYPWGHEYWSSKCGTRPTETPPVPPTLDWDLWLGPAPNRPYHSCYHPLTWRAWWDFGSGMICDRGTHQMDPIYYALDLDYPETVEAYVSDLNKETHPLAVIARYEFPAKGKRGPVTFTWYDGLQPPRPRELSDSDVLGEKEGGTLFKGSEGMLTCNIYGGNPRLVPAERMAKFTPPAPTIPRITVPHEVEWINAIKEGRKACADFSYSGPLTEVCQLGNIAKRVPGKLQWDHEKMVFPNKPEANQYVLMPYREGWSL